MDNLIKHDIFYKDILKELCFIASRSSGKGGQNVNKVSTKITLIFDIKNSRILDENSKEIIKNRLRTRINAKGQLKINVSNERYQSLNKSIAIKKFFVLINNALESEEIRIMTKPKRISIEKRLFEKANLSVKKKMRIKKPLIEE